ncbi:MAG: TonB family protein [Candidatus Omnitrophica bacterium]|nr:TonB family protein [Candidatus Omnitrophota bacterium]
MQWPNQASISEPAGRWNTLAGMPDALFRISDWSRETFSANVNFLIQEGKARILSRPRVVCQSGKEAELMVGGEVPMFETNVVAGGGSDTDIEYKEYGIKLNISPVVTDEDKVQLTLNVEVSEIGEAEEIGTTTSTATSSGRTVTARAYPLTKRTVASQLFLHNGETLVLGGLISQKTQEDLDKFPWLADVPILGAFFRNRQTQRGGGASTRDDKELFITLTPKILYPQDRMPEKEKMVRARKQQFQEMYKQDYLADELQEYILNVQEKIYHNMNYPSSLVNTGWQGTVILKLWLGHTGSLNDVRILKSSGYSVFDEEALKLVRNLQYSPFPSEIEVEEIKIEVPIVYRETP